MRLKPYRLAGSQIPGIGWPVPLAHGLLVLLTSLPWGSVLAIEGGQPTTAFGQVGIGVQVTPNWVLAARHNALAVGQTYANGYGSATVAARYDVALSNFPSHDLSLLRLASAIAAPAVPVDGTLLADGDFAQSLPGTIVSAGNPGPPWRGVATVGVGSFTTMLEGETVNYLISLNETVHVQGGDSGGGLFVGSVADAGVLWGINSALIEDDQRNPKGSAFVHLAAYRDWIDARMLEDAADLQAIGWVSAVPEPGTPLQWAVGLLALGAWAGGRGAGRRERPGGFILRAGLPSTSNLGTPLPAVAAYDGRGAPAPVPQRSHGGPHDA